jgi:hypothetical protein
MNRNIFLTFIILITCFGTKLQSISPEKLTNKSSPQQIQDTVIDRQILYNGIIWKNKYHRIEGDQFLFSDLFLPATISISGRTFTNVRIKYDIFDDEIITPVNFEDILQLNKEMVDSFSISYEGRVFRFVNLRDSTSKSLTGYLNLLYKGSSSFYIKYSKSISPHLTSKSDGTFNQKQMMYLIKEKTAYQINGTRDLYRIFDTDKEEIRDRAKKNKLRISKKVPESFIPVIRIYDSIRQKQSQ